MTAASTAKSAQHALEIHIATFGPEHSETGDAYDVVGQAFLMDKKYPQAAAAYQKALEIKEQRLGKDHETVGYSALGLGLARLELGEAAKALPLLERVLTITHDPRTQGDAYFGIARAMDALGRKGPEVISAAQKGHDALASVQENENAQEISDWIAQHSVAQASTRAPKKGP